MDDQQRSRVEALLVAWLLALRAEYLRAYGNSVSLKHWDHLQNRMRSAAETTGDPTEWMTAVRDGLRLGAPSLRSSTCSAALLSELAEEGSPMDLLDLVTRRHAVLIARGRNAAEELRNRGETEEVT